MHEYYYSGKVFTSSPLHRNPKYISSGFYSYADIQDREFSHSFEKVRERVNVDPIAGIVVQQGKALIRFGYCTNPAIGSGKVLKLVKDNLPLLEKFNAYFLKEMADILDNALTNSIYLPNELGKLYDQPGSNEIPASLSLQKRLDFLKQIGLIDKQESFTKREVDYLQFIAKGMTCSQIAKSMQLSKRTVENYIGMLRQKFRCNSKADLVEIAQLF